MQTLTEVESKCVRGGCLGIPKINGKIAEQLWADLFDNTGSNQAAAVSYIEAIQNGFALKQAAFLTTLQTAFDMDQSEGGIPTPKQFKQMFRTELELLKIDNPPIDPYPVG